ncbi:hypothetical protein AVEN_136272-1 [Araneus ventricosus]|uniref:Uncharacterized protein n=1 Tax=Araneus ventricosus TaxID=182803 RepID=A0A4Y2L5X1_ARAVE|nr:hypothetical protein AVEN_136272-1 [Araneus ventricosus]
MGDAKNKRDLIAVRALIDSLERLTGRLMSPNNSVNQAAALPKERQEVISRSRLAILRRHFKRTCRRLRPVKLNQKLPFQFRFIWKRDVNSVLELCSVDVSIPSKIKKITW